MARPAVGLSIQPALSRFIYYKLLTLVPVSAALTAMLRHGESAMWAVAYVGLCLGHAAIMNAAKCPHCPYYKAGDRTFACFIWWGMPKLWADRQAPKRRGWAGTRCSGWRCSPSSRCTGCGRSGRFSLSTSSESLRW